ncbi:MAG TPA: SDR family oxidoreductase [Sedimentisphaerales bacterium]|nr:SDR family oxidoreductase [Sedimentisphaerales bacterium]HRS11823.1 SDR family oxidoreductase [Sedimentisphaerales bacterium]HRV48768.1 SDR family oxidoreductase [Sedimentisphaerales bacterium]
MDKALADLIRISTTTGRDPELVLGGGGNTSVKTADGKYMYIKASGTALKDMSAERGWRRLRIDSVLSILTDKSLGKMDAIRRETEVVNRLLLSCDDNVTGGARPSVEAHLHALLDTHVIHLHPLVVAAYVSARKGRAALDRVFAAERITPLWVPYTDPGYMLARKIARLVAEYEQEHGRKPRVLFLEKHGLFVTAGSADAAIRLVRQVIELCTNGLKPLKSGKVALASAASITAAKLAIRKAVFEATGQYLPVSYYPTLEAVSAFLAHRKAARLLATPALNPDELVYANGSAMWVETVRAEAIARRIRSLAERGQKTPAAFVVKGLGLFVAAEKNVAGLIADITDTSLKVRMHAAQMGGVLALTKREQDFINNWESEAFRKKLVSSEGPGELLNRIAIVTGAGSGLGRSIAIGLSRAGAMVALADVDEEAAQQTAQKIAAERPMSQTMVVPCDVTSEASVQKAFEALLAHWGGLDIVVNAAGLAPPYALVDMPVDKWRLALEVNLTGYFLMARQASRILIQQGIGGNIINLSSKSGLDASKNNSAYNATKAGELHLARGWALELGEHGIRVNCVAPGNVFEGSKIWNPEYIKVCAKKYGIKPEEVIPYYIGKTALKREIKGQDIADAIVFLCSDRARTITGQVLVADSGQVMVR